MPYLSSPRNFVRPALALFVLPILAASASMAESPTVAISSANLKINWTGTDSYSIQGSIDGISLHDAKTIVFGVGQFGAALPLSAFTQQAGTNVYKYQDATGLRPYWLTSLTIDLDANTFTASASGIVLSGLQNPFRLQLGTGTALACGMVRMQGVSGSEARATSGAAPEQYELTPGDSAIQTCAIPASPVANPPDVSTSTPTQVKVSLQGSGIDAKSAQLFIADANAQPSGKALCVFSESGKGNYSCAVSFNQAEAGVIPLIVQATVKGRTVLAPGFSVQVVAAVTNADIQQQLSKIQNLLLSAGDQAYGKYGDSVAARVAVLATLRKQMPYFRGLTGQAFGLGPNGSDLGVVSDSGVPVMYTLSDPDMPDPAGGSSEDAIQSKAGSFFPPPAGAPDEPALRPGDVPQKCGDFARPIVSNDDVLVWDPGSMFFHLDPAPKIASVLQKSMCPHFQVAPAITGLNATLTALLDLTKYGTVIMVSHGGVDNNARSYIVTGGPSGKNDDYIGKPGQNTPLGSWCTRAPPVGLPVIPEAQPNHCFLTVYSNYFSGWQLLPNTIIYGGFCDGFSGTVPGQSVQVGIPGLDMDSVPVPVASTTQWQAVFGPGPNNAYISYNSFVNTAEDQSSGMAFFNRMVNMYSTAFEAVDNSGDPKLESGQNGQNLAYVGNPHLVLTNIEPDIPGSQVLAATLEGTDSCSGYGGSNLLNVQWTNPATAGHLKSMEALVSGSQDDFTNQAFCDEATGGCDSNDIPPPIPTDIFGWALAQYTPDASLPGDGDNITADFLPNPAGAAASRACLAVEANVGLFVESQLATIYNAVTTNFSPIPTYFSPFIKVTGSYPEVKYEGPLPGTADITVTPFGPDNFHVEVTVGGGYPYDGYASIDLSARNPGPADKATVQVVGMWNLTTQGELNSCGQNSTCNFPDGVVLINTGLSATYQLATQGMVPFNGEFGSAFSPVDIYIGINANDLLKTASTFTLSLDIYFHQ
jgi:hypothetical protein